jgi:hypothetical protein
MALLEEDPETAKLKTRNVFSADYTKRYPYTE